MLAGNGRVSRAKADHLESLPLDHGENKCSALREWGD
jgi:hypothetical protein